MNSTPCVAVVVLFVPDRDQKGRAMNSGKWMAQPMFDGRPLMTAPIYFDDKATAVDWADKCRAVIRGVKTDPAP